MDIGKQLRREMNDGLERMKTIFHLGLKSDKDYSEHFGEVMQDVLIKVANLSYEEGIKVGTLKARKR